MKILISCIILNLVINKTWIAEMASYAKPEATKGWQLIGTTEAKLTNDNAGIAVHGPNDSFNSIKLKVTNGSLEIVKMVITYDYGAPDNFEMLYEIPKGGESRVIDLSRIGDRKIKRIDFWYDTSNSTTSKTSVAIYGMK